MSIATQPLPIGIGAKGAAVTEIQMKLIAEGADMVPDGDFGTVTADAVTAFQVRHRLNGVGFVGPKTAAALDAIEITNNYPIAAPSILKIAPWLSTMRAISGTKEFPGAADNPVILKWRETIGRFPRHTQYVKSYNHDSIAWCGLTVAYSLAANNIDPIEKFLWALNWSIAGRDIRAIEAAIPGAIMAFERDGGGHVAIYEAETPTHWIIRGGNQSDMCSQVQRRKADDLRGIMWPASVKVQGQPRKVSSSSALLAGSEA